MGFGFHETYVLSFCSVLYMRVQPTWLLHIDRWLCYANIARSLRSKHLVTVFTFARVNTSLSRGPNREFDLTPLHSADVGIADAATFPAQEENKVALLSTFLGGFDWRASCDTYIFYERNLLIFIHATCTHTYIINCYSEDQLL